MNFRIFLIFIKCLGAGIAFIAVPFAQAQEDPAETPQASSATNSSAAGDIESDVPPGLVLDEETGEYRMADEVSAADGAEDPADEPDVPEGLVYDEQLGEYRLAEDPEQEGDWIDEEEQHAAETEELRRLFLLYREALDNKAYMEADTLAKRIVELSIKLNGLDSQDSAKALTNLAIAQHNNRDFEAAQRNFMAAIGIIERIEDRLSASLINPLRGLAATQAAVGRADLARASFQRAVHVSHVNEGPHNKEQVDTLESMAELYMSIGEWEDALDIQENIYSIQARKIDPKSMDILPALENQAAWQHRLRMYHRERVTWRKVIDVIERHHGKNSLLLIPPLTQLGKSYLFITPAEYDFQPDASVASGETYLRRANRIAIENEEADWELVEDTMLALADYYILSGRPNRASKIYGDTWDFLSSETERHGHRRENLEKLNVLQDAYPPRYYNVQRDEKAGTPSPENFETGTVSFSFTVSETGRISQIKHLETYPPEITDFRDTVARSMRHMIYRPRVQDRAMVRTTDVIFTHEFFYRPSDIPDPAEFGEPEAEAEIAAEQVMEPDS